MLTYEGALDYLYSFIDYSSVRSYSYSPDTFDLERLARFLGALGNPHTRYPALHIAGTKGKGSVAAMCASALRAAGYRTGLYTSPHLLDFSERIQVDGQPISPGAVGDLVAELKAQVPQFPGLTTFELTTALGFLHFARENVDVAVLEVGLGGRLDATNVVLPRVAVITSVSLDHMALLGNNLAEIAGEKGGIIKPGVPVVVAPQQPEALARLEQIAAERGAPLTLVGRDWLYRPVERSLLSQAFEIWSAQEQRQLDELRGQGHDVQWRPTRIETPLLGLHQVENGAVAYAALHALKGAGLPLSADAIRAGLGAVHWPGRFEVLGRHPFLVLDGAHNVDSAAKLAATLVDYFPGRRVILVFGVSVDKDAAGMLAELLRPEVGVQHVVLTQAVHSRARAPEELAELLGPYRVPYDIVGGVAQAVEHALQLASPEDVVLACGSLFLVAEARPVALQRASENASENVKE